MARRGISRVRLSPRGLRQIAGTVGTLAVALIALVMVLAVCIDALEQVIGDRAVASSPPTEARAEMMVRPTLHLEARSLSMFGDAGSECS